MRDTKALSEHESAAVAKAYEAAEASLRLEGLDPTTDDRYMAIKQQVIDGSLTFDEAAEAIRKQYKATAAMPVSA